MQPGLWGPRSFCEHCRKTLNLIDLVPVLGFILRRGKCAHCGFYIPRYHPLVEGLGAIVALLSLAFYGINPQAVFIFMFLMVLITLGGIDARTGYLPDVLTLPLLWFGLLVNLTDIFVPLQSAVLGAALGYLIFRIIADIYEKLRGTMGLGLGDAKLLAAIGAWVGVSPLPVIVLLSSILGLGFITTKALSGHKIDARTSLPFGPCLVAGTLVYFLLDGLQLSPLF